MVPQTISIYDWKAIYPTQTCNLLTGNKGFMKTTCTQYTLFIFLPLKS